MLLSARPARATIAGWGRIETPPDSVASQYADVCAPAPLASALVGFAAPDGRSDAVLHASWNPQAHLALGTEYRPALSRDVRVATRMAAADVYDRLRWDTGSYLPARLASPRLNDGTLMAQLVGAIVLLAGLARAFCRICERSA